MAGFRELITQLVYLKEALNRARLVAHSLKKENYLCTCPAENDFISAEGVNVARFTTISCVVIVALGSSASLNVCAFALTNKDNSNSPLNSILCLLHTCQVCYGGAASNSTAQASFTAMHRDREKYIEADDDD